MTEPKLMNEKELKRSQDVIEFLKVYSEIIIKEGWFFYNHYGYEYMIGLYKDLKYDDINTKFNEILNLAREYGWIVNPSGYVVEYDESRHIRNRHLLTGYNLGLL